MRTSCRYGIASLAVYGVIMTVAGAAFAEEPLRLDLLREPSDLASLADGGECVRGRLYVVRRFDAEAAVRRVWVADVLELKGAAGDPIPSGQYAAGVHEDAEGDWRIELTAVNAVLAASDPGAGEASLHLALLGRRPEGPRPGACVTADETLEDRSAIVARLRKLTESPGGERAVEVRVRP